METAAEIYTRIIFPNAASKIDPHLSEIQKAMLDATPDCIKVLSVDGNLLTMNKAGCRALGVAEDSSFGMPWLPLLPDEIHTLGEDALNNARAGRNARFPGKSVSLLGVIYWDNLLTPLIDGTGQVLSILCVSRDVTAKTLLERELEEAISREKLLSREMQHRIKNLFSVASALISIAERESADSPESTTTILREKLNALSRASDAVFAQGDHDPGAYPADLESIIRSVLKPYGERCLFVGDAVTVHRNSLTTLALLLHELATNSVKYGALGNAHGTIAVNWAATGDMLDLQWTEALASPVAPQGRGFGSEMMDRIVRSEGGTIDRIWRAEGLTVGLRLPTVAGRSSQAPA